MLEKLTEARLKIKKELKRLKALEYLLDSKFELEYLDASEDEQEKVAEALEELDYSRIRLWYKGRACKETMRCLRNRASALGIPYYTTLSRSQLLKEIEAANGIRKTCS